MNGKFFFSTKRNSRKCKNIYELLICASCVIYYSYVCSIPGDALC